MRAAALALALMTVAGPARAVDFGLLDGVDGRPAIRISGDILPGDAARLGKFLESHHRVFSMILSGDGGSAYDATKLGIFVHAVGMPVVVPAHERCASACALVWAGASQRFVEPGAAIGFHGVFTYVDGKPKPSSDGNAIVGAYLARVGLSDAAIIYITAKPPAEMQWLNDGDARRFGLNYVVAMPQHEQPEAKLAQTLDAQSDGKMSEGQRRAAVKPAPHTPPRPGPAAPTE